MELTDDDLINIAYLVNKEIGDIEQILWHGEHADHVQKYLEHRLRVMGDLKAKIVKQLE